MSRDKRIAALRKHTPSPDAFYDYNMEKVLPRHNPGNADFSKVLWSASGACARHHAPPPWQSAVLQFPQLIPQAPAPQTQRPRLPVCMLPRNTGMP